MLTNKGFTLIETLFVLMIICILSSLSMNLHMPRKSEEVSLAEIESFIRGAQFIAMNQKVTITLQFSFHQITYHGSDHEGSYQLPENSYFETHTLTFNEMGHIKGAKTLTYHTSSKNYHFVFQIGSGAFYVQ